MGRGFNCVTNVIYKKKLFSALKSDKSYKSDESEFGHPYLFSRKAACAAAKRAIGTRKGEQET